MSFQHHYADVYFDAINIDYGHRCHFADMTFLITLSSYATFFRHYVIYDTLLIILSSPPPLRLAPSLPPVDAAYVFWLSFEITYGLPDAMLIASL